MVSSTTIVGMILVAGLVLSVLFCAYCLLRREERGARSLAVMFVGVSLWVGADLIQIQTPGLALPPVGVEFRLVGPDITVFAFLLFALEYTGRDHLLRPAPIAALLIKPLLTVVVLFSPAREALVAIGPAATTQFGYGLVETPLFLGHTLYSWVLTVGALGLLAHMMLRANKGYRRQIILLTAAIAVPFAMNVGFHTDLYAFDPTSMGFFLTASLFMFVAFRLRLLDALPIARQTVLEEMDDIVLVLDEDGTIITGNEQARETFGVDLVGESVTDVLGTDPQTQADGDHDALAVEIGDETQYFDVTRSSVTDYRENVLARVLVCRDVTDQRKREHALRQREEELDLLKDLQSRFLRHNLRNELNVVQVNAELIVDEDEPDDRERYGQIKAKTDRLLEWSDKTRMIERLVETDELVVRDLSVATTEIVDGLQKRYPQAVFDCDLSPEVNVVAVPQVDRALRNLLDNAARHNDTDQPIIEVRTAIEGEQARIVISDNGPGMADHEIETIENRSESSLQHASGFGLWLVYWVANKSGAELSLESGDGTTVELRFRTPEASSADAVDTHEPAVK